jgi:hypothetical protein
MAIDDFWLNLRTAASFYAPSVAVDAPLDAGAVERMLRGAMMWLTPRSVEGFNEDDFAFLEEEQRATLRENVERFRTVASQVPAKKPATPEQVEQGQAAFGEILRILQPHRFRDAESLQTQILLERELRGKLPRWVTGISCETGLDLTDDPAIWIRVDVTDSATDKGLIEKHGLAIAEEIRSAYQRIGGRRWPFVRFRSPDAFAHREEGSA